VHVLEEDDGSGWVKVAHSGGSHGLVPATYLVDVNKGPFEPNEPSQQQGSGLYGANTAFRPIRSNFISLLPCKQCGRSTTIKVKDQMNLRSMGGTLLSCHLEHTEVKIMQMVGGKVLNGLLHLNVD
jgi:hypothetical protein